MKTHGNKIRIPIRCRSRCRSPRPNTAIPRSRRFCGASCPTTTGFSKAGHDDFRSPPRNAFRLIANVGEDCAGAVQVIRPDRLEPLRIEPAAREIAWLTEDDIAVRLRALRADHSDYETTKHIQRTKPGHRSRRRKSAIQGDRPS